MREKSILTKMVEEPAAPFLLKTRFSNTNILIMTLISAVATICNPTYIQQIVQNVHTKRENKQKKSCVFVEFDLKCISLTRH